MTTKKLLIIWFLLIGGALGGYGLYTRAEEGLYDQAKRETTPYVPVPDLEAVRIFVEDCGENHRVQRELFIANATCESASAAPSPKVIRAAHESHKQHHYDSEIWPRQMELMESMELKFAVFCAAIALLAAAAFLLWCKATLYPFVDRSKKKFAPYAALPEAWKGASTRRIARRAQEEFDTLRRLHEDGLISDETFAERKEAIRAQLCKSDR